MQLFPVNSNLHKQLHRLVDYHYCIGEIVRIEGLADGYCNQTQPDSQKTTGHHL